MQYGTIKKKSAKQHLQRGRPHQNVAYKESTDKNLQFFSPNLRVQMPKMNVHQSIQSMDENKIV
jgi:hypothetical protein